MHSIRRRNKLIMHVVGVFISYRIRLIFCCTDSCYGHFFFLCVCNVSVQRFRFHLIIITRNVVNYYFSHVIFP